MADQNGLSSVIEPQFLKSTGPNDTGMGQKEETEKDKGVVDQQVKEETIKKKKKREKKKKLTKYEKDSSSDLNID